MGEKRNAYGVLARKPKRNRPGRYLTNMLDTLPPQVYGTSLLIWQMYILLQGGSNMTGTICV